MPPLPDSGSIRVFLRWDDQTVFAGEDIKCRITFKNVAPTTSQPPRSASNPLTQDRARPQPSPLLAAASRVKSSSSLAAPPAGRGHRSTLSLNVATNSSSRSRSTTLPWTPPQPPPQRPGHAHKRSLSIVSISSIATVDDQNHVSSPLRSQRPPHGHGRSNSLQISPRPGSTGGPHSATFPRRPGPEASPVFNHHSFPPASNGFGRSGASTAPPTPSIGAPVPRRRSPLQPMPDWKFPSMASPSSEAGETVTNGDYSSIAPSPISPGQAAHLPMRSRDSIPIINEHHSSPAARILSTTSIADGTPRSSGEFYSLSNNSSETLASEYVSQPLHGSRRPPHLRHSSGLSNVTQPKLPEMLMMGYAQIQGSFTLDGSLVNLGPFEAVKRKAVLGGQGGGVIGVESTKRSSLLQGFGWGSFGNSIGELLGGNEYSSIKEMRGTASTKSIPLLSTPQSILFVDLQLAPGESKTYEYTFKLPKGLPPTHKGKAIKISYNLVIGTQRPGGAKGQQVRTVEIPFRVLGSVNSFGEILGHDLLSPYIILRDQAKVSTLEKGTERIPFHKKTKSTLHASSMNDFVNYVDELLSRPRNGMGLLSPTATAPSSRRPSVFEEVSTAKDAIDLAIMRSNLSSETGQSSNRFEIARNGRRIGVILLARPAYRLGESVNMAIDFTGSEVPCYAVHAALETTEKVDPSIALRSEASVHRVTRKIFGSSSESTLFAQRIIFNPTIPINATPEFVTTGLSLEWKIRIEFVVPTSRSGGGDHSPSGSATPHHLLEEIARDERGGLVLVAVENLECESFEVAVPLRVYGAVCNGLERLERDEALDGGLLV